MKAMGAAAVRKHCAMLPLHRNRKLGLLGISWAATTAAATAPRTLRARRRRASDGSGTLPRNPRSGPSPTAPSPQRPPRPPSEGPPSSGPPSGSGSAGGRMALNPAGSLRSMLGKVPSLSSFLGGAANGGSGGGGGSGKVTHLLITLYQALPHRARIRSGTPARPC